VRPARRKKARAFGLRAETLAAVLLRLKGYAILARNYRLHGGEVDLIVRRGKNLVFVEVKARPTLDEARLALNPAQTARMSRAARVWLSRHPESAGLNLRADAIFIAPGHWPHHLEAVTPLDLFW